MKSDEEPLSREECRRLAYNGWGLEDPVALIELLRASVTAND